MINKFKYIYILVLLISPFVIWAFYKPARVIFPDFINGLVCEENLCVENVSKRSIASVLYKYSIKSVSEKTGQFHSKPTAIFCLTEKCFNAFGFKRASAATVGYFAIIISPRGWKPYYIRHELLHYRQAEELGLFVQWRAPKWFTEGMAYSLSEDPRKKLAEPFQSYLRQFNAWYRNVNKDSLWKLAKVL